MWMQDPKDFDHPSFSTFSGHNPGSGSEIEHPGHKLASIWDAGMAGRDLAYCAMVPATAFCGPQVYFSLELESLTYFMSEIFAASLI